MVIVYASFTNDKLTYILDEIFRYRLGLEWALTNDTETYHAATETFKINYSLHDVGGITVPNSGFLETTGVIPNFEPPMARLETYPVLFPDNHGVGFDVFSMAFWCLSRYEEYQPYEPDEHGRFSAAGSFFFEAGLLEAPILDMALEHFYHKAGFTSPDKYAIYPTLDIDIAFKHKGKNLLRSVGGFLRYIWQMQPGSAFERLGVWLGAKDPWDTFAWFTKALQEHKNRTRIFIHAGELSEHDKPVSLTHSLYAKRLQLLSENFSIGIHPSYTGGNSGQGIAQEKKKLENALAITVDRSRHHFLKFHLPETYRYLQEAGITHDYSMGFADQIGFRAGTGHSFRFYDLPKEKVTALVVHPFCAMDVTLKNYQQVSPVQARRKTAAIKELCIKYKVPFCFIFHNESLSNKFSWRGWRAVFEAWLK